MYIVVACCVGLSLSLSPVFLQMCCGCVCGFEVILSLSTYTCNERTQIANSQCLHVVEWSRLWCFVKPSKLVWYLVPMYTFTCTCTCTCVHMYVNYLHNICTCTYTMYTCTCMHLGLTPLYTAMPCW